jgi:hypothetical protein
MKPFLTTKNTKDLERTSVAPLDPPSLTAQCFAHSKLRLRDRKRPTFVLFVVERLFTGQEGVT